MVLLIVDDDAEDIEIFCEAVKSIDSSLKCISANSGAKALDILQSDILPDVIFLDINMPLRSGKDILIDIRKNHDYRDIVVVMYSTTMNPREMEECRKIGANDFLIKPSKFQDLCTAIEHLMKRIQA